VYEDHDSDPQAAGHKRRVVCGVLFFLFFVG
jgi:hypothetical protein